ncbi:hypothetical protein BH10ACT7_BH10ACT7_24550 [soil metagenome]
MRVIAASPERIWSAWTSPSELPEFFAHPGTSIPPESLTMDVRSGGALRLTVIEADGERVTMDAVYVDVDEPALLSWHWTTAGASGTGETMIAITEVLGGTEVTSRMVGHLGPAAAIGYRRGVTASLEALDRHVTGPA